MEGMKLLLVVLLSTLCGYGMFIVRAGGVRLLDVGGIGELG